VNIGLNEADFDLPLGGQSARFLLRGGREIERHHVEASLC